MALIFRKPTTPSQRFTVVVKDLTLSDSKLEKSLVKGKRKKNGRSNSGRISVRRAGGGHKRKLRTVDFKRNKIGINGKVVSIQYDPNRSANLALINYQDGEKRYIIAPIGLEVGATVQNGPQAQLTVGNALCLKDIPVGHNIHNIELKPGSGGVLVRSAGNSAILSSFEKGYAIVRLPSGEIRKIHGSCMATLGRIGNEDFLNRSLGKAGKARWLGKRPSVRGTAMNPIDHPHGGGNGKTKGRHLRSPWGQPTKGFKTRSSNKTSDRFIISSRKKKR